MIKHLIKLFWSRKRSNFFLLLEVFLSFIVLFTILMLFAVNFERYKAPLGFNYDDVYNVDLDLLNRLDGSGDQEAAFEITNEIIRELEAMPEVIGVASVFPNPYGMGINSDELKWEGRELDAKQSEVSDKIFEVLDIEIIHGRAFNDEDDAVDWKPVIINQILADELFRGEDPLGKIVEEEKDYRVVGVMDEFRYNGEFSKPQPTFLTRQSLKDHTKGRDEVLALVVEVRSDVDDGFEERAAKTVQLIASDWSTSIKHLPIMRSNLLKMAMIPYFLGIFVGLSLMVMVVLGMVGVFWQSVIARIKEIGLRRAMGGTKIGIYKQFLGEIAVLALAGSLPGIIICVQIPVLGIMKSITWELLIPTLIVSTISMVILAILSGLYPAWLASKIHPSQALHYE